MRLRCSKVEAATLRMAHTKNTRRLIIRAWLVALMALTVFVRLHRECLKLSQSRFRSPLVPRSTAFRGDSVSGQRYLRRIMFLLP